ncbi:MAG: glycosyltransferase, partial [Patescibacteria group bacterium]
EIIVVDDNSPDKTWQIVQQLSQKNHHLRLIRRINQRGLTSAFNRGIQSSQGDIIGWLDSDLSHPPALLDQMYKKLKMCDAVVASRYIRGAKDSRKEITAVIFSRLINLLSQILLDWSLTDFTSGYILVKKIYLSSITLQGDYGEYFIDLLLKLKRAGALIKEIPYNNVSRVFGESKTGGNIWALLYRGRKYIITIFSLWLKK